MMKLLVCIHIPDELKIHDTEARWIRRWVRELGPEDGHSQSGNADKKFTSPEDWVSRSGKREKPPHWSFNFEHDFEAMPDEGATFEAVVINDKNPSDQPLNIRGTITRLNRGGSPEPTVYVELTEPPQKKSD